MTPADVRSYDVPLASTDVTAEVSIAGEGCVLSLRLTGWQYPELDSGSDANWVVGEIELAAGSKGRFTACHPVTARTEELAAFCSEMATLLQTLTGEATLTHLESQFGATVTLEAGVGVLEVFVREHVGAELRVGGVRTDQSYLAETLRGLKHAVAAFGVRGSAFG
jgi:hypothetical protein